MACPRCGVALKIAVKEALSKRLWLIGKKFIEQQSCAKCYLLSMRDISGGKEYLFVKVYCPRKSLSAPLPVVFSLCGTSIKGKFDNILISM